MNQKHRDYCTLSINGQHHMVGGKHAFMMLADFLRGQLRHTGTKVVCAEGDCGACTVLCYRERTGTEAIFVPINACIVTVAQLDGCHIVTVEGLKQNGSLSAVQQAMVDHHGSQCGFCTPGFVMAMTGLYETPRKLNEQKVKNALTGNLCRCTGYQPIINAALSIDKHAISPLKLRYARHPLPDKDICLHIKHDAREIFAPTSLTEAALYKQHNPHTGFLGGATDMGVATNKGKFQAKTLISLHLISELYDIQEHDERIIIGARVTLAQTRKFLQNRCKEFASFIDIFASPQIKNMATIVGNVANASPIGDTLAFFLVTESLIHAYSINGERIIPFTQFFESYKKTALKPDEIVTHMSFALPKPNVRLRLEKVSQRRDMDIASINAAFLCMIDNDLIQEVKIALGGVDAVVKRLYKTEQFLVGKLLSDQVVEQACSIIHQEISPLSDLRGSAQYRSVLAEGLFRRYCHEVLA